VRRCGRNGETRSTGHSEPADRVAHLLPFSRRGEEKISTVDIRQELAKTVELVQHYLRKQQITVVLELAEDTPLIYADRQK
jgi:two-component system, LuxR family, sensor kinase FixL